MSDSIAISNKRRANKKAGLSLHLCLLEGGQLTWSTNDIWRGSTFRISTVRIRSQSIFIGLLDQVLICGIHTQTHTQIYIIYNMMEEPIWNLLCGRRNWAA